MAQRAEIVTFAERFVRASKGIAQADPLPISVLPLPIFRKWIKEQQLAHLPRDATPFNEAASNALAAHARIKTKTSGKFI
jgi:hypothetical protein